MDKFIVYKRQDRNDTFCNLANVRRIIVETDSHSKLKCLTLEYPDDAHCIPLPKLTTEGSIAYFRRALKIFLSKSEDSVFDVEAIQNCVVDQRPLNFSVDSEFQR